MEAAVVKAPEEKAFPPFPSFPPAKVEEVGQVGQVDVSTRLVTWMQGITGMGIMLSILKNIIGGVTDVMVGTFSKFFC